ncbi:NAD-dependent epimerase/dehydratase family protein [Subsaxibacter sp. CAU 1640]|uniref:NAD-dependent epimerase/dehydratase family protein n=1 Tax=Subsaxibacter sp. CAU 1640 TaxID=2933271 RepID=UPI0020031DCD|nr:NAD-dependent epimerase/dehydratase family protein [Subsaxibacter sp. CAU 1640]MCK7589390.1 NAD-dependent epimerase/dehydratase family protein [Subsaxibacter sp. CAU 1640]
MSKTAIILGATGLTGSHLLQLLLDDERYARIIVFGRKTCGVGHSKLTEHIVNVLHLENQQELFQADEVFCCIGTTKAKTPNKDIYTKIDYGIPTAAAKLCKENGIETFMVISALGAKKKSKIFYNRVKGKMEEAVLSFNIKNTYILQPSLISGERDEKRIGESIMKFLMSMLKPLLRFGDLERYRPIHPKTIAKCMVWLGNNEYQPGRVESKIIQEITDDI